MNRNNLAIVRQSFANTVFTHKVQEMACEREEKKAFWVKIANVCLVAMVLMMLALQLIFRESVGFAYIGAGITIAEVIFLISQLTFNFERNAIAHKNVALKYMGLRDCYKNLITDIMENAIELDEIRDRRDLLQREYQVISDLSPQTQNKDYQKAQTRLMRQGIHEGEDFTWSDAEINHFLPENLHI